MSRNNRSLMSENLKRELARDLGVADIVQREGWGSVPAEKCGALVRAAVQRAVRALANNRR